MATAPRGIPDFGDIANSLVSILNLGGERDSPRSDCVRFQVCGGLLFYGFACSSEELGAGDVLGERECGGGWILGGMAPTCRGSGRHCGSAGWAGGGLGECVVPGGVGLTRALAMVSSLCMHAVMTTWKALPFFSAVYEILCRALGWDISQSSLFVEIIAWTRC